MHRTSHRLKHGTNYDGNYYVPTSNELKQASKVAYFGWYQNRGTYGSDGNFADPSSLKQYAFTQQFIWETLNQSSAHFVDSSVQAEYETFKAETTAKMNRMSLRPSFDGSTITLRVGETTTLTDTNDVLKDYNSIDRTENNIRITHNKGENTMSFTPNENCTIENYRISDSTFLEWGCIKEGTEDSQTTVYIEFQSSEVQDQLYSLNYNDPVTLRINLTIEAKGRLELIKTNDNRDLVDGSVFIVTGPNDYYNEVTVSGGKIVLEDLLKGFYSIKEKSAKSSYLVNTETYTVEIKPNETTTKTIVNKEPTRNYNCKKRK